MARWREFLKPKSAVKLKNKILQADLKNAFEIQRKFQQVVVARIALARKIWLAQTTDCRERVNYPFMRVSS